MRFALDDNVTLVNRIGVHIGCASQHLMTFDDLNLKKVMKNINQRKSASLAAITELLCETQLALYKFELNGVEWVPFVSEQDFNEFASDKKTIKVFYLDRNTAARKQDFKTALERYLRRCNMRLVA
jgi:hypothetical protein